MVEFYKKLKNEMIELGFKRDIYLFERFEYWCIQDGIWKLPNTSALGNEVLFDFLQENVVETLKGNESGLKSLWQTQGNKMALGYFIICLEHLYAKHTQ